MLAVAKKQDNGCPATTRVVMRKSFGPRVIEKGCGDFAIEVILESRPHCLSNSSHKASWLEGSKSQWILGGKATPLKS